MHLKKIVVLSMRIHRLFCICILKFNRTKDALNPSMQLYTQKNHVCVVIFSDDIGIVDQCCAGTCSIVLVHVLLKVHQKWQHGIEDTDGDLANTRYWPAEQ